MPDNAPNLVSIKVSDATRDWLKDEQRRLKRAEGEEPTQAELVERLIAAYGSRATTCPTCADDTAIVKWVRRLTQGRSLDKAETGALRAIEGLFGAIAK